MSMGDDANLRDIRGVGVTGVTRSFVPSPARGRRDRFRVVFYDDIVARPMGLLEEVCGFAGLDFEPRHFSEAATRVVHRGPEIEMPDEVRRYLVREYVPAIRTLSRTYPQAAKWLRTYT